MPLDHHSAVASLGGFDPQAKAALAMYAALEKAMIAAPAVDSRPMLDQLNDSIAEWTALHTTEYLEDVLRCAASPNPPLALARLENKCGAEIIVSVFMSCVGTVYKSRQSQ